MSTSLAAVVFALVGVAAVVGVAWAFYLVGRAEERDREAELAARRPPEPEPKPEPEPPDHAHENGRLVRERRRPLPPRRPG
jgi:hypothetical protein